MEGVGTRHERVYNPELVQLSKEYQQQKRASRESYCDLHKMIREARYLKQLNHKLSQQMFRGKRKIQVCEDSRQRHHADNANRAQIHQLRLQQQERNRQIASGVRRDRELKARAVRKNTIARISLAEASRCESRRHKDSIEQDRFQQYLRNKERVEDGLAFKRQALERALGQKQLRQARHIDDLRTLILKEKKEMNRRCAKSVEIRAQLKHLTQQSESKVRAIQEMQRYLEKFRSPYYSPLVGRRLGRCGTEGSSREQSTFLLSQPSQM